MNDEVYLLPLDEFCDELSVVDMLSSEVDTFTIVIFMKSIPNDHFYPLVL